MKNDISTRTDLDRYRDLAKVTQSSWWEADFVSQTFTISDYLKDLLELDDNVISFDDAVSFVREDYRELISTEIYNTNLKKQGIYNRKFPVISPRGELWIKCILGYSITDDNRKCDFGSFQVISTAEPESNLSQIKETSRLLKNIDKIAVALSDFLTDKDEKDIVDNILNCMIQYYGASDAYIAEFTNNDNYHQCTFVVSADSTFAKSKFGRIKSDDVKWWTKTIKSNHSIVLDSLSQLPPEAKAEYQLLKSKDRRSIMVIPLTNDQQVWGYVGIYTAGFSRQWNNEDYLWMLSMANILGVCIELSRERQHNEEGQLYKENLIKNMPIGYTKIKVIRGTKGDVIDYRLSEVNMCSSLMYGQNGGEKGKLGSAVHDSEIFAKNKEYLEEVLKSKTYMAQCMQTPSGAFCKKIAYLSGNDEIVEFNVDISETIEAVEAAKRSNELFRNVFVNMPIGAALYDNKGYVTDMNNSFKKIFGITSFNDIRGYSFFEDVNITEDIKKHALLQNQDAFIIDYDFNKIINYNTTRRDVARLNSKLVHLYYGNKNIGFMLICIEDTDRLIAINKVRDFENFFTLISEYAKIGYAKINILNDEGYAIRQWYKNLNEDDDKCVGEIVHKFDQLHPDDRQVLLDFIKDAIKGKKDHLSSVMRTRKEDSDEEEWNWIFQSILLSKYEPERGIVELVGVNYDITEFKDIEQELIHARDKAQEMDRLKSAFLANMSHEIRTPLNAIVGFSDLLINATDKKEKQEFFNILRKNNDMLLQLINDILDLSKIEAGTMQLTYENVDVNKLCNDIIMSMSFKTSPNVKITFEPSETNCFIKVDSTRLNQVITNFMTNAIKFTTEGSITLTYSWIDDEYIKFSVTDTGIGIDEENKHSIFDRFVKLNSFIPGTGLGLSICRSIVELLKGKIGVDSVLGEGSSFWFVLPKNKK